MVAPSQIGWGSYQQWEGPYYTGKCPFTIAADPSWGEKVLAVVTATEGGHFDAINMYDRMIVSSGLIQFGEAGQLSVSNMLGVVAATAPTAIAELNPALAACNAKFRQNSVGNWRFVNSSGQDVDMGLRQNSIFRGGCSGTKGSWSSDQKAIAKLWAACIASVFEHPDAQEAQIQFTVPRLESFVFSDAHSILWGPCPANTGLYGAMRSAYISFAANLPVVASQHLKIAVTNTAHPTWSYDWCVDVLRELTFGPGIAIYPGRYDKIRPVIESLFDVDLPDYAAELRSQPTDGLGDVKGIQTRLIALGYHPGVVDGSMGPQTIYAVKSFQADRGLPADGIVGPLTRKALSDGT